MALDQLELIDREEFQCPVHLPGAGDAHGWRRARQARLS
jgi:hypothetical protein